MAEYPIIMKQKNDQGNYDTLYPKTLGSQVEGMTLDQVSGNLASSRIDGDIPSSQITGLPTSLPANGGNADTVGNQTVTQIIEAAISQGAKIVTGSYVGTGTVDEIQPNSLTFEFEPNFVWIFGYKSPNEISQTFLSSSLDCVVVYPKSLSFNFTLNTGFGIDGKYRYGKISTDYKTISWYNTVNNYAQLNVLNNTYYYIAIG